MDRTRDYWDANVWAAYALKDADPHYAACRHLFDDLHDGKRVVVVPALVVGEVIQVIRREAVRDVVTVCDGGVPSPQAAQDLADEAVRGFFHNLAGLASTGRVIIGRPSQYAGQYAGMSLRMMIRHMGSFEPHGKMGLIHRGLGMFDMMHALAARDYGVQNFCTRDRQFRSLAGDPEFAAINFVVF